MELTRHGATAVTPAGTSHQFLINTTLSLQSYILPSSSHTHLSANTFELHRNSPVGLLHLFEVETYTNTTRQCSDEERRGQMMILAM